MWRRWSKKNRNSLFGVDDFARFYDSHRLGGSSAGWRCARTWNILDENTYRWIHWYLTAMVLSVESRWINTTDSNLIYSFAEIKVQDYQKNSSSRQSIVRIVYMGGTQGKRSSVLILNPWGRIECYLGQIIKFYGYPDAQFDGALRPIKIDIIKGAKTLDTCTLSK